MGWSYGGVVPRQNPGGLPAGTTVPGIVIVKLKTGQHRPATPGSSLARSMQAAGVQSLHPAFPPQGSDLDNIFVAGFDAMRDPGDVAGMLASSPDVEYAEPKYVSILFDTPDDPLYSSSQSGYFGLMNAPPGWTLGKGDSNVVIADVDGGTYWLHPDLLPNVAINPAEDLNHNGKFDPGPPPGGDEDGIDQDGDGFADDVAGWNFANGTNDPRGLPATPQNGAHGTATASHFGAVTNNGLGMAGSSWNCRILPINASSSTTDRQIIFGYEGIAYAARRGARVINCSWGRSGAYSLFEQDMIDAATQAGALVVASAGNDNLDNDVVSAYPASYRGVLAVGATGSTSDKKALFSNYGVSIPVYAPGENIVSAFADGTYGNGGSGTSYSSPLVAGLAGILASTHPAWSPAQIAAQIRMTADPVDAVNPALGGHLGEGRVNFGRALTETPAGLAVTSTNILTPAGGGLFITGDTVLLSMRLRNVLPADANGATFSISVSDSALYPLDGPAYVSVIPFGAEVSLPVFRFLVGGMPLARIVRITVSWAMNGTQRDAVSLRTTIFPSVPRWLTQESTTRIPLASVKTVSKAVAWASGGNNVGTAPVVLRTANGGAQWKDMTAGLPPADLYCVNAVDSLHAWVGTGAGGIYGTTDGGTTWNAQPYPGVQSPFIDAVWFFDPKRGYALGDPGSGGTFVVLTTTDGGQTWAHCVSEPAAGTGEAGWNNSFWWTDTLHGWLGTNKARVWRTADGGRTWQAGTTSNASGYGIAFKDALNGILISDRGRYERSSDGGATWQLGTVVSTSSLAGVAYVQGSSSAWISDGIAPYRSSDDGATWSIEAAYPFAGSITHVSFVDTSSGWAVTTNGEVLRYGPDTSTRIVPPPIPAAFALDQNYPNPFNGGTIIAYHLPSSGEVTMEVFDILGRRVETLVRGTMSAGDHVALFSGAGLASGVYLYRLTTPTSTATKKMILLR
jgi:photosystem II stability/assembly factor-like uncharacterized protein